MHGIIWNFHSNELFLFRFDFKADWKVLFRFFFAKFYVPAIWKCSNHLFAHSRFARLIGNHSASENTTGMNFTFEKFSLKEGILILFPSILVSRSRKHIHRDTMTISLIVRLLSLGKETHSDAKVFVNCIWKAFPEKKMLMKTSANISQDINNNDSDRTARKCYGSFDGSIRTRGTYARIGSNLLDWINFIFSEQRRTVASRRENYEISDFHYPIKADKNRSAWKCSTTSFYPQL